MDELFQRYSEAFDSFDANAIASLYMLPCATFDNDGPNVFSTKENLVRKFENNCKTMKSLGYLSSEFNIQNSRNLGANLKAITVGWRIRLREGNMEFCTHYICNKKNNQWLVYNATVYEGSF